MTKTDFFSVSTINVNGIRAAARKGFDDWLVEYQPDVLLLQEVRAEKEIAATLLGERWDTIVHPSAIKGRAGVAIAVRKDSGKVVLDQVKEPRFGLHEQEEPVDSGRWVEADLVTSGGRAVRLVSAYFHSGQIRTPKQDAKMAHLARIDGRMGQLLADASETGVETLVAGDFNVVHTELDIKNWKGNYNKTSGVLDEEMEILTRWVDAGWGDTVRMLTGQVPGPYSWWSWRGRAFDNDTGWRIDYHFATPTLAKGAREVSVYRAPSWDTRFSDHAPVTVTYEI